MSDTISSLPSEELPVAPPAGRKGRGILWIGLVTIVAWWAYCVYATQNEMSLFERFGGRMFVLALVLLVFLTGWFWDWRYAWRERLWSIAALFVAWGVAGAFMHPSYDHFNLLLAGLPIALTAWWVWNLLTQSASAPTRTRGLWIVMALSFGAFGLLRWNGMTGRQESQIDWRWSPNAEERNRELLTANLGASGFVGSPGSPLAPQVGDWLDFRGENRMGTAHVSAEYKAADLRPQLVWKQPVGPAWSSLLLVNGHLITQEQRGENEAVVCYDAETGKTKWASLHKDRYEEILAGVGPRATPVVHADCVFALGTNNVLRKLDSSGAERWSVDLKQTAAAPDQMWGSSITPLIIGDTLLVYAGGPEQNGLLGLDVQTGEKRWGVPAGPSCYSSPQPATLHGVSQVVVHHSLGLTAVNPETGAVLWEHGGDAVCNQPMLQPRPVGDDRLLIAGDSGLTMIRVQRDGEKWSASTDWMSTTLNPTFNDVVVHRDAIFGLDDGILSCISLEKGERLWKKGRYGSGQLLLIPELDVLFVAGEKGQGVFVAASPEGHRELLSFAAIAGKVWNHPILAHDRLYVRSDEELACYRLFPDQVE